MIFLLLIVLAFLLLQIQDELMRPQPLEVVAADCPGCGAEVDLDWMVCPHCLQRLRETCPSCDAHKMISHVYCPGCGRGAAS